VTHRSMITSHYY